MARKANGGRTRIAYLAHGIDGVKGGVHAKILSQSSAWVELDPTIDVGVFVRCESGVEADWANAPNVVSVRSSRAGMVGRLAQRELLAMDLWRWKPDLVYLRQSTVSPSVIAVAATIPTVIELNTLDLVELRMRSRPRYFYALATRDQVLRRARGLVAVAGEIRDHPSVRRLRRPTAVVPNGIDLAAYPLLPPAQNDRPRLAFLGSPRQPWHGVDQIASMARAFPTWTFDVFGPAADQFPGKPGNITVHGLMDRTEFLPILGRADVAVGPLSLHRVGLNEASPLKVAEYLAYGLPTIIGYTDTRFPSGAEFLLQLPTAENGVAASLDRIDGFVRSWIGRRVDRLAVAPIDTRIIERRRLDFMLAMLGPDE